MLRAGKGGLTDSVRGGKNKLAARGYRGRGGHGEQVEGGKKASADTGGKGQWEWTLVQVESWLKTRREGGGSGANRLVPISLRVDWGGSKETVIDWKISIKQLNGVERVKIIFNIL